MVIKDIEFIYNFLDVNFNFFFFFNRKYNKYDFFYLIMNYL